MKSRSQVAKRPSKRPASGYLKNLLTVVTAHCLRILHSPTTCMRHRTKNKKVWESESGVSLTTLFLKNLTFQPKKLRHNKRRRMNKKDPGGLCHRRSGLHCSKSGSAGLWTPTSLRVGWWTRDGSWQKTQWFFGKRVDLKVSDATTATTVGWRVCH